MHHIWIKALSSVVGGILLEARRSYVESREQPKQIGPPPLLVGVFGSLAKMAKCDGLVCPKQIAVVEGIMDELNFDRTRREQAMGVFRRAKDDGQSIDGYLNMFGEAMQWKLDERRYQLSLLHRVAMADGRLSQAERTLLYRSAECLRLPAGEVAALVKSEDDELERCYTALGCHEGMSSEEIRTQFRRRCKELHPDVLHAKALPPELIEYANKKMAELKEAYERILRARE